MNTSNRESLIVQLQEKFDKTIDWLDQHPEHHLNAELYEGKWTALQHIYHLIKSTKAVSKGMAVPKVLLWWKFGKCNRPEKSFDHLYNKYIDVLAQTTVVPPSNYTSEPGRHFTKAEIIARFKHERSSLIKVLNKWNEHDLSNYILPHPAIGKLTIREMIYFTIFHTQHHLDILEKKYNS